MVIFAVAMGFFGKYGFLCGNRNNSSACQPSGAGSRSVADKGLVAGSRPVADNRFGAMRRHYLATMRLAVPVAVSQLGYVAVTFADNAMVGAYGGEDTIPLSAVAFAGAVCYILFFLGMGITLGITPIVGELFAQGRRRESAQYLQNAIVLYSLVGILLVGVQLAAEPLLYRLGQPVEVVDAAIPYYRLMSYSILPVMFYGAFRQFLEGVGNTRTAMVVAIISNCVNILLNWVFIFGHCGFEPMGVTGAGVATLVARTLNPLLILICFAATPQYRSYFALFSHDAECLRRAVRLLKIGLPIAGQMVLEMLAWTVTGIMMGWFGAEAISANQIGVTYGNCAFMLIISLGSAATIRVSHAIGRRDYEEMRQAMRASLHLAVAWNLAVTVAMVALRHYLPLAFSSNGEVVALASQMLIFYAAYQIPDAVQCVLVGILRGMQDVRPIARNSFIAYILLNIPIGYLLAFVCGGGADYLIAGYFFGLMAAAILYALRVRKTLRRLGAEMPQGVAE